MSTKKIPHNFWDTVCKKWVMVPLVLFLLVVSNITTLVFLQKNQSPEVQSLEYPLIDFSRNFIDSSNFFSTVEPLRQELKNIVSEYEKEGYRIGLYFEFLNTGANISINQDERFQPASLSKMPTALTVMKKIEKDEWELSNELVLFLEDRNDGYGDLYKKPAGTRLTIEELLKELLINSDDTAHRIFIRNLAGYEFEEMLLALGMADLYDSDYNITAKEYSRIFRSLYTSSFLDREQSSLLLNFLVGTPFDTYIQAGLPDDVVFSHKIGEHYEERTFLDSGIVYIPNRPYLVTVMIQTPEGLGEDEASLVMKNVSEKIYLYVANYEKD